MRPRRLVVAFALVITVIAFGLAARVSHEASTAADRAAARLDRVEGRIDQLEAELLAQAVDLAAARTALTLLRGDVQEIGASIPEEPDVAGVTRRVLESVFTVSTGEGGGSAFVVATGNGTSRLVTNAHVLSSVWNNGGRGVELVQGDERLSGVIEQMSFSQDLALISVAAPLKPLRPVIDRADPGTPVLVVGSPLGLEGSVVSGVVSSYRVEEGQQQLQLSAPINPGNSGGPVTDVDGNVLGVVVAKYVGFGIEGLSFAVPSDVLCSTFDVCGS